MDILYYKQGEEYIIEMSQDNIFIKYNFNTDKLETEGVENMDDEQINQIKNALYKHEQFVKLAPYGKDDIYKQSVSLDSKPVWFKNDDIKDWMLKRREEENNVE